MMDYVLPQEVQNQVGMHVDFMAWIFDTLKSIYYLLQSH